MLARQQRSRTSRLSVELAFALRWWLQVLSLSLCEERSWRKSREPCGHLFCDARSHPPRVAAVLCIDRQIMYSDWQPDEQVMRCFQSRNDGQIMSLEILSVAFGGRLLAFNSCPVGIFCSDCLSRHLHFRAALEGTQHQGVVRQQGGRTHHGQRWCPLLGPHMHYSWHMVC